jgi:hypothetical protein
LWAVQSRFDDLRLDDVHRLPAPDVLDAVSDALLELRNLEGLARGAVPAATMLSRLDQVRATLRAAEAASVRPNKVSG